MKKAINKLGSTFIVLLLFFSSCSKKVDYSDYLNQAERVYPGRADSIVVRSGYQKAEIVSLLSSDPRVAKIRIFWNNRRDSVEANVTENDYSKWKTVIVPVIPEGMYVFEVVTLDAMNHRSVPSEKTGQIYGEFYVGGLVNRVLKSISTVDGSPAINWYSESEESPIKGVSITYPTADGGSLTVFTPRSADVTVLSGAAATGIAKVRTEYLPENAVETFYSSYIDIPY